ncbi:hypothetical protein R6Q59_035253 [Mikania micrantha]
MAGTLVGGFYSESIVQHQDCGDEIQQANAMDDDLGCRTFHFHFRTFRVKIILVKIFKRADHSVFLLSSHG